MEQTKVRNTLTLVVLEKERSDWFPNPVEPIYVLCVNIVQTKLIV